MPVSEALFSSETEEWSTPQGFFDKLNQEFHFRVDLAAAPGNNKCEFYHTRWSNALTSDWASDFSSPALRSKNGYYNWCNPPYGREIIKWVRKAYLESTTNGAKTVMLLPARTDTKWFTEYVFDKANEIGIIKGRLKFVNQDGETLTSAPFPSLIAVYRGIVCNHSQFYLLDRSGNLI